MAISELPSNYENQVVRNGLARRLRTMRGQALNPNPVNNMKLFEGYGPEFDSLFVGFFPDGESQQAMIDQVVEPIQQILDELGINAIVTTSDFPAHSTFLDIKPKDGPPLNSFDHLGEEDVDILTSITDAMKGQSLEFSGLVMLGSSIVLVARNIPDVVPEIKKKAAELIVGDKAGAYDIKHNPDFLAFTIAKFKTEPTPEQLKQIYRTIRKIHPELRRNPLRLTGEAKACPSADTIPLPLRIGWKS